MHRVLSRLRRGAGAALTRLDAAANALYGWRFNPLYQSGTLAVAAFLVLLVTGLYLLLFYRIGNPWASVEAITAQTWTGRWIRSLHRYASGLALAAAALHALRMFVQGRSWGPRALAWVSGVLLFGLFLACGWTGYVMVWDEQAHLLAVEGARLFDVLPLFSEPIGRAFVGERPMPPAFFFLNLFAHIALPVGVALLLWVHVSRLARTRLLPPRGMLWGVTGLLTAVSLAWPVPLAPEADLLRLSGRVLLDVFYGAWLPVSVSAGALEMWFAVLAAAGLALLVPLATRPRPEQIPPPSAVEERYCTGCEQCSHDCPWEAIRMVPRTDGRSGWVAQVDPVRCVRCGICAASCAPMGVGPAGRTGRDQLAQARAFVARVRPRASGVVLVACRRGGGAPTLSSLHAPVFSIPCAGALHTSVIEYLVRAGWGGVLVAACPPRDCWNREGATWLEARVFHGREAALKERVDRRRIRIVFASEGEHVRVLAALRDLAAEVAALAGAVTPEREITLDERCEAPAAAGAERSVQ